MVSDVYVPPVRHFAILVSYNTIIRQKITSLLSLTKIQSSAVYYEVIKMGDLIHSIHLLARDM